MSEIRIMPMQNPLPLWDKGSQSKYPDELKMAFRDGQVRVYRLEVEQPKPFIFSKEAIRIMEEHSYGGYKARHAKMTGDAATSTGQRQNKP